MIILISGTSGSGKTFLARRIMGHLPQQPDGYHEIMRSGGKVKKIGLFWSPPYDITVLGKYDNQACGGCDCLSWKGAGDDMEALIVKAVQCGQRVLLEGLMVSAWGIERLTRLLHLGVIIVHIDTPLEECLAAVNDRRRTRAAAIGKSFEPVNPDNTAYKYRNLRQQDAKRKAHGIPVVLLNREDAYEYVVKALGLERNLCTS